MSVTEDSSRKGKEAMPRYSLLHSVRSVSLALLLALVFAGAESTIAQQFSSPLQDDVRYSGGGQALPQETMLARPFPPLNKEHLEYIDQLLEYWEFSSNQIEMFECGFNRWVYDPVFGPRADATGEMPAKTISSGTIRFEKPDKGSFHVAAIWQYGEPDENNNRYHPAILPGEDNTKMQEQWVCDGAHIYEFNYEQKQLIRSELSPQLRGEGLAHGPLPFFFGARKDDLKARYWLRCINPDNAQGQYWLEAYPKYIDDARNYYKVIIILDEKDFLPAATEIFEPNYDPQSNPARTFFEFKERKITKPSAIRNLDILQVFRESFRPKKPFGWDLIDRPYREATATAPNGNNLHR